ncbi:hypothetical protein ACH4L5_14240 [Streptomyces sp. NPDC017405]|uniref:hypothetical protein n=1 Tax=unclassified Streptomyces TaxID=2593676 RepID=UPI0037892DE3
MQRLAVLPLRPELGAVRIPGGIVHAAVGTDDREKVAATVRDQLNGPVIQDVRTALGPTYWALVSYRADARWDGGGYAAARSRNLPGCAGHRSHRAARRLLGGAAVRP